MNNDPIVESARLYFRPWTTSKIDRDIFYEINSDEELMRYYPFRRTREQSDETLERMIEEFTPDGMGWGVVCLKDTHEPIGFTGLNTVNFDAHFVPAVEIGWRFLQPHWKKGYATEIANELLKHGFENIGLSEVVAFTAFKNHASAAVMERLNMQHNPEDNFDMPDIDEKYAHLNPIILYRLSRARWQSLTLK